MIDYEESFLEDLILKQYFDYFRFLEVDLLQRTQFVLSAKLNEQSFRSGRAAICLEIHLDFCSFQC